MIYPPALRPGDTIAVVAPSGPIDAALARAGIAFLAERYRVRFDEGIFARSGFLAGPDERRREELSRALEDPSVRAILAARGGYGAARFAHELDWGLLARSPRWIVGFSDVTVLHIEAARAGVASLHASHVTMLGRDDAPAREALVRALEHPGEARVYEGLGVLREGTAEGTLFGGNLTLLHAAAAAGRLFVPEGAVLLLEDVTERPYRIDRMLGSLALGGHFARVAAVVLGEFTQCDPASDGVTVEEVLREILPRLGVPVLSGVPVGHGLRNDPVVLGGRARVEAKGSEGTLRLGGAR